MHLIYRGDERDADTNIQNLATHLQGKIRTLESQRARIASGPNAPELRQNDLAAIDAQLAPLRFKAEAAANGHFYHDSRDPAGCDPEAQKWAQIYSTLGRYVTPSTFGPSLHASEETEGSPLRVIRGGNGASNLGSPSMTVR